MTPFRWRYSTTTICWRSAPWCSKTEAEEITANLRPNPVLQGDAQFLPIFQPDKFSADYINTTAQFDVGLSYLFERGRKRQHRLQAARDVTEQSRFTVTDNERKLMFLVASQYIDVQVAESTIDLAAQDLKSFQNTVDISESRYKAGDISEVDFLKIKIQLLQFQTDMSQAQLAKVQALASLRQSLGYESVPADYDVASAFDYAPVTMKLEDLQAKALADRPDLRAARQGVTAANSQYELQKAIGKVDPTGTAVYSHVSNASSASFFGNVQIPIFNRNQGEILKAKYAITQAEELAQRGKRSGDDGCDERVRRRAHERSDCDALPLRLFERGAGFARHQRVRVQARRGEFARLSGRRAQLSRDGAGLPAGARVVSDGGGAIARSGGNEDAAMKHDLQHECRGRRANSRAIGGGVALTIGFAILAGISGCESANPSARRR